jgi:hypothetical protein
MDEFNKEQFTHHIMMVILSSQGVQAHVGNMPLLLVFTLDDISDNDERWITACMMKLEHPLILPI